MEEKVERLEAALNALLNDVAANPHTAVSVARSYFPRIVTDLAP